MIYGYRCEVCNHDWERVCSLAAYEKNPGFLCPMCVMPTHQILYAVRPLLSKPFEAFISTVDGSLISSRRDMQEHNKRNNVVNLHDGYDEAGVQKMTQKNYQEPLDKERGKDLHKDVEKAIAQCADGYKPVVASEVIPDEQHTR